MIPIPLTCSCCLNSASVDSLSSISTFRSNSTSYLHPYTEDHFLPTSVSTGTTTSSLGSAPQCAESCSW